MSQTPDGKAPFKGKLFDIPFGWKCGPCNSTVNQVFMRVKAIQHAQGFHLKGFCATCGHQLSGPMWVPHPADYKPGDEMPEEPDLFGGSL